MRASLFLFNPFNQSNNSMRSVLIILVTILFTVSNSFAQSRSYEALKEKFSNRPDVHSFSFGAWMGRLVLKMAGEHEFTNAIKDVKHVRLITIPKQEFAAQHVSVKGFKKLLKQDYFEELAFIRDTGEEVTIYLREGNNNKNHYFVLVEEEQEVVAIELKGYIDPKELNPKTTSLALNK
jgi:hypothetical protein